MAETAVVVESVSVIVAMSVTMSIVVRVAATKFNFLLLFLLQNTIVVYVIKVHADYLLTIKLNYYPLFSQYFSHF